MTGCATEIRPSNLRIPSSAGMEYESKSKVDKGSQSPSTITVAGPEVKCCFLTQLNFREGHQGKRPKRYHVPFSRFSRRPRPTRTRRGKSRFKLSRKWGALFRQSLRISGARFVLLTTYLSHVPLGSMLRNTWPEIPPLSPRLLSATVLSISYHGLYRQVDRSLLLSPHAYFISLVTSTAFLDRSAVTVRNSSSFQISYRNVGEIK